MKWFKFYGQDYLTDPKMNALDATSKVMWITLLCLYSGNEGNPLTNVDDWFLARMSGYSETADEWYEKVDGTLEQFKKLGLIENDNGMITLNNFEKRQNMALSGYERVKKFRESKKNKPEKTKFTVGEMITNDNVDDNANDNVEKRVDKKRIDKNIYPTANASDLLSNFNRIFHKELKSTVSWEKNLAEWLNVYSVSDMVRALEVAKKDQFYADKMTPEMLLRKKNPRGEDCDRIGELLSKEKKPKIRSLEVQEVPYSLPRPEDVLPSEKVHELIQKARSQL